MQFFQEYMRLLDIRLKKNEVMEMKVHRKEMLESEIQKLLSEALLESKDPRIKGELISFTMVRLSNDKRYADVYVSVLGDEEDRKATLSLLEKAKGFFRSYVAKNLRLYTVPEIRFREDRGIESSVRIHKILEDLGYGTEHDRGEEAEGEEK